MFLIAVDVFSKWPEIVEMTSTTAGQTVKVLRDIFARYGLPEQLVSDNSPQFVSSDFADFCKSKAIKHVWVAPYHPASNGLAERMVQTFKQVMRRTMNDGLPWQHCIADFLLTYRTTPHSTTNVAPCILLMGRVLQTRLNMLRTNLGSTVCAAQAKQKQHHDEQSRSRDFGPDDQVLTRDFRNNSPKWISGVVLQSVGPVSYMIQLPDGTLWKQHVDYIRQRVTKPDQDTPESSSTEDNATESSPFITYPLQLPTPANVEQSDTDQTVSLTNSSQATVP